MEKVVIIGLGLKHQDKKDVYNSLDELELLVNTAHGEVIKKFVVFRDKIDPAYYIGCGKLQEIKDFIITNKIRTIVFDNELSPAQIRNLEEILDAKIVDRTRLILDIFAQRAITKEAQLQVELAQLNYMLPRLTKKGVYLDNQVGGIGTRRGPGETKLEYDRRKIMQRIDKIKTELKKVVVNREIQKKQRIESQIPIVVLVGYTNAGKSTLFNVLVNKSVSYADDKLFATLDPLVRKITLPSGTNFLITDTVGFINKLPHHLVESFKSTLEIIKDASLIIEVIDITNQNISQQSQVVQNILEDLNVQNVPKIKVYNKIDLLPKHLLKSYIKKFGINNNHDVVFISAKNCFGIKKLIKKIELFFKDLYITKTIKINPEKFFAINDFYKSCKVISNYIEKNCMIIKFRTTKMYYSKLKKLLATL